MDLAAEALAACDLAWSLPSVTDLATAALGICTLTTGCVIESCPKHDEFFFSALLRKATERATSGGNWRLTGGCAAESAASGGGSGRRAFCWNGVASSAVASATASTDCERCHSFDADADNASFESSSSSDLSWGADDRMSRRSVTKKARPMPTWTRDGCATRSWRRVPGGGIPW